MSGFDEGGDVRRRAREGYLAQAVMTAGPERITAMLFDGAMRRLDRAEKSFVAGDPRGASDSVSRAFAVVRELRSALDFENGGDIARDLDALYEFVLSRLTRAQVRGDVEAVREAKTVVARVKEGWDGLVGAS